MKAHPISKLLAMALVVVMVIGMMPISALAASVDYVAHDDYYKVITKSDYELAPGIVESEIVLNNTAGTHRQVAHVVEVDINNEYAKVIPSYKGMIPTPGNYGVQIMSEQAAYAEANGYGNVVAAMNLSLSWYDSAYYLANPHLVGEPLGYMILDGVQYTNSQGKTAGAKTCVVINFDEKDGVARPADIPKTEIRSTSSAITGWEEQVIPANFDFLVKNGVNQYKADHVASNGASRSFVGIKEDGTFVMVMNDGRQAPYSTGFTNYEMAEFMLSLGCVQAVNGDGGGSSAFLSQRPGEELKINCAPSDGAERETTHGVLVISTAPATGEFVRATVSAENDYYTPGSSVQFTAIGSDLVGTAAEIPEDVIWQLADPAMGTIEDGLFVSNGTVGVATAQMVYNGEIVGEASVEIVIPEQIAFTQSSIVVPFGKTAQLSVVATINDGIHEVVIKPGDITLTLDNDSIGELDGVNFTFAAVAEENAPADLKGTLTATLNHGDGLVTTVPFSVGKGSDIVYDFEDQDLTGWSIYTNYGKYGPVGPNNLVTKPEGGYWYHGQNERGYLSIVDASTGKVRNGDYALAVECDFSQIYETGYHALNLMFPKIDCTDSLQIGFWLYVPYDARHAEWNIGATNIGNGQFYEFNEGWHYIKATAKDNQISHINISIDDRAAASAYNNYNYITEANLNGKYTYYIDDITVDYSTAVDDREIPVFGNVEMVGNDSNTALNGAIVTTSNSAPTFEVKVADDTTLGNSTGLNASSAVAYVDGKAVACTYKNGRINVSGVKLSDGVHDLRFEIADNAGNTAWAGGKINVATANDTSSTVKVVPQNPNLFRPLIGSLYWMDVVATDIETIDKVEMTFDLNNASSWELEGIETIEGFEATYSIQEDDNLAFITLTRVGENTQTGEAVLASFPVRTWVSTITEYEGYEDQTPATLVARGIIWKQAIELALQRGVITYVKGYNAATTGTFGMEDLTVDTEVFFTNYCRKSVTGAQEWINAKKAANVGWHEHTVTEIEKEATCTQNGYIDRTYCEVCDSVVDWGTTLKADGHKYEVVEDTLKCACGDTQDKTGFVEVDGTYYYMIAGKLQSGWLMLDDGWYYFNNKYAPVASLNNGVVTYTFENNGKLTSGVWYTNAWGKRYYYGPDYYLGTMFGTWKTIDGVQYCFDNSGYIMTGMQSLRKSHNDIFRVYEFTKDGAFVGIREDYTGFVKGFDATRYFVDGVMKTGLQAINNKYYYFSTHTGDMRTGEYTVTVANSNGLLDETTTFNFDKTTGAVDIPSKAAFKVIDGNTYYFFDDGTMAKGLHVINDMYYYFSTHTGIMRTGDYTVTVANSNGLLTANTKFFFDTKTGAAEIPSAEGFKVIDGNTYYYFADGTMAKGLHKINGKMYYFSTHTGIMRTGEYTVTVANSNGLLTANTKFFFDTKTGAAEIPSAEGFKVIDGNTYYYFADGTMAKGLNKINGNLYYFSTHTGIMRTGEYTVTVANSNGLLITNTKFYFDEVTGAARVEGSGSFKVVNGQTYYYFADGTMALGLHQIDGKFYYFSTHTGAMRTGEYAVNYLNSNGLLKASMKLTFDTVNGYAVDANGNPLTKL